MKPYITLVILLIENSFFVDENDVLCDNMF